MGSKNTNDVAGKQRLASRVARLGWIIWGIAIIGQILNQFYRVATAMVVDNLMADFEITAAAVGGILATYFYVYAAMQFPSGILADYVGPRKTVTFGCLIAGAGSVVFGLAPTLPVLYLGRFLLSLGVSVIFVSVLKLQTQWFRSQYFGRISSLTNFVAMFGALIGTAPMAYLVTEMGWRLSFELMGVLSLAVSLACWLVIRDRPGDLGLPSLAEVEKDEGSVAHHPAREGDGGAGFRRSLIDVLKNKYIWPPFLIAAGSYGTLLVFQGAWGVPYLMQVYSMSRDTAARFMLLMMLGYMVGTVMMAFISDWIHRRKLPAVICSFAYLLLWILLTFWNGGKPPVSMLYPIFFFIGFFAGFAILALACAKEVVPLSASGMAMGLVNMSTFLCAAVLQMVFGGLLDLGWRGAMLNEVRVYPVAAFQTGFVLVCVAGLTYIIGALLLKETRGTDIKNE